MYLQLLTIFSLYHFDKSVSKDSRIYIHRNESSILLHSNQMFRNYKTASWITEEEIVMKPSPGWNCKNYQVNGLTDVIPLNKNSSFDLGNFYFKVSIKFIFVIVKEF